MWCKKTIRAILLSYALLAIHDANGQTDIPVGTWRMHISYNTINSVTFSDEKIYGAAESGIAVIDRDELSLTSYSKINGLTGSTISFINYA